VRGLCIDACDTVMKKIGRDPLIGLRQRFNIHRRQGRPAEVFRLVRPRTIVYSA